MAPVSLRGGSRRSPRRPGACTNCPLTAERLRQAPWVFGPEGRDWWLVSTHISKVLTTSSHQQGCPKSTRCLATVVKAPDSRWHSKGPSCYSLRAMGIVRGCRPPTGDCFRGELALPDNGDLLMGAILVPGFPPPHATGELLRTSRAELPQPIYSGGAIHDEDIHGLLSIRGSSRCSPVRSVSFHHLPLPQVFQCPLYMTLSAEFQQRSTLTCSIAMC